MPIYEYRCTKGHVFDAMQRFSDDPLDACEVCGASTQRVFHAPAVHFKGSGFYNTDYGTRKRAKEMKENGSSEKGDSSSDKSASKDAKESKSSSDSSSSSSSSSDKPAPKKSEAKASTGNS